MVFQDIALFPYMTVRENIGYPLKIAGVPRPEVDRKVEKVAEILAISDKLPMKPAQLSGGQQQKILMDIILDDKKPVWFLDEPLTNMDSERRHYFWITLDKAYGKGLRIIFFIDHWLDHIIISDPDFQHHSTLGVTMKRYGKGRSPDIESQGIQIYKNSSPHAFFSRQALIDVSE
jgi:ABC-type Fe3+/spermidine/putrescine transport system ATPase subunit